jgi:hypothetical protein
MGTPWDCSKRHLIRTRLKSANLKIFTMNSKKGLVSNQSLQGRIVSKAEFNHYVHSNDNG